MNQETPTLITALPTFGASEKRTYTVDEIQDILGIGRTTAYKLVKEKKFHSVNIGHRVVVSKKSFDEWLGI